MSRMRGVVPGAAVAGATCLIAAAQIGGAGPPKSEAGAGGSPDPGGGVGGPVAAGDVTVLGPAGPAGGCAADITGPGGTADGNVDALDFLLLIGQWGSPGACP